MSLKKKNSNIFISSIIEKRITLNFTEVDKNLKDTLKKKLASKIEEKCSIEGYIKKDSVNIITYSSGVLNGNNIYFDIVYECLVCNPVEGMIISCIVKDITKAGIRAELSNDSQILAIFIARDHHYLVEKFSSIKIGDKIKVKVLGQRFELNDKFISVIAELIDLVETSNKKPKLKLKN